LLKPSGGLFAGYSCFFALFWFLLFATATTQNFLDGLATGKFRQPSI
jgi:hypothetical protein